MAYGARALLWRKKCFVRERGPPAGTMDIGIIESHKKTGVYDQISSNHICSKNGK
jgi:hypothetical protein